MTEQRIVELEKRVVDLEEKATAATAALKNECVICNEMVATLQNDDDSWICEDCAQHISDLGHEFSLEN